MPRDSGFQPLDLPGNSDLETWAAGFGNGPVLIDLDHTLLEANSFELFLETVRPRTIVSIVLWLAGLPPWHLFSRHPDRLRDSLVFLAVICLMPWTLPRWKRLAPGLFRERINAELVQVLARCPPDRIEIVTFGFLPVVSPMLRGSPWENCRLNATTARLLLRQDWSKLSRARRFRPDAELAQASFVTDSAEDADLLGAVANGCLISPAGPLIPARHKLYFPLRYTAVAKYSPAYLRDQTLFVDLPVILFAFVLGGRQGLADMAAALLLYFSLMCIYEIGYFENDQNKATREARPRVTAISARFRNFPLPRHAWAWALVLGALGIGLEANFDPKTSAVHFAAWMMILIALRGWFYLYNKRGSRFRVLAYPVLQAFKYAWPLAFAAFSPLAGAIMAAQVIAMWAVYIVYRHGGEGDSVPRDAVRIGLVLLIAALAGGPGVLQASPLILALVVGWLVWRITPKRRIAKGLLGILRGRQSQPA